MKRCIKNNKNGFTLVELLAVIVILAIILVIAVPKVMTIIEDSKKATLETTAKMIASSAEKAKIQNEVLGKNNEITCDSVAKMNKIDYDTCTIEFDGNTAKVNIKGSGKFSGINICSGTKNNVEATNDLCTVEYGKASTYIQNLEAFTENNGLIKDTTVDKNVRYAGSNPNNYVYFNCEDTDANSINYGEEAYDYENSCEIWRIIGVFKVNNGSRKVEKRVKLVRDAFTDANGNVIGMSWDSSTHNGGTDNNSGYGINQWGASTYEDGSAYEGADLMQMLNGYYIGEETECRYCTGVNQGICKNDCSSSVAPLSNTSLNMINSVLWNTGAQSRVDPMTVSIMYTSERGTQNGKICASTSFNVNGVYSCTDTVNRTTEWNGLIGLIYPSDYAYASKGNGCFNNTWGGSSACMNNNWLYPKEWYWSLTVAAYSDSSTTIWVGSTDLGVTTTTLQRAGAVRPSLYLSSDVKITGGDGTETTPFKLSVN